MAIYKQFYEYTYNEVAPVSVRYYKTTSTKWIKEFDPDLTDHYYFIDFKNNVNDLGILNTFGNSFKATVDS